MEEECYEDWLSQMDEAVTFSPGTQILAVRALEKTR